MAGRNLSIQVAFRGINQLSGPVEAARKSAAELASQVRTTQKDIKALGAKAGSFDRLAAEAGKTSEKLEQAKTRLREMRAEYGPAKQRTAEQTAALKEQGAAVDKLRHTQTAEEAKLKQLRGEFYKLGVTVKDADNATEKIKSRTEQYNRELATQQKRLDQVNKAQERYARTKNTGEALQSAGMKTAAAGGAILAPVGMGIRQYSAQEDAMKGVARQVSPLISNGKRTADYADMQKSIADASETLPLPGGFTDYAALVEGGARMGAANSSDPYEKQKQDLLTFANTAAMASTAFELPAGQLAEDMGKIAGMYKIPIKNISDLGDTLNYLDDNAQSKGSDIIDVMLRIGGAAEQFGYKNAAALSSTLLTFGEEASTAGTAVKAIINQLGNAKVNPDNFHLGIERLGLDAKKLQQDVARDAMGTLQNVLEKIRGFDKDEQTNLLTLIFGKEYSMVLSKVTNNLPELRRQIALTQDQAAKGSMKRESDINKDSLSAQFMIARTSMQNTAASLTEPLRASLIPLMQMVTSVMQRIRNWVTNNQQLAGTLIKITAAIGAVLAAGGALMMMFGTLLGPLSLVRLSFSMLAGNGGMLGMVAGGMMRLGGLFQWLAGSPLQLLATAGRMVFGSLITLIGSLGAPIWAIAAVIAAVVVAVIKFWEPIKAFFSGFFEGLIAGLQPVFDIFKSVFEPMAPIFDLISSAISKVVDWFSDLLTPIKFSSGALESCTSAGRIFGEVVGTAISVVGKAIFALLTPIRLVTDGLTWILEKLELIPDAATRAAEATKKARLDALTTQAGDDMNAVVQAGEKTTPVPGKGSLQALLGNGAISSEDKPASSTFSPTALIINGNGVTDTQNTGKKPGSDNNDKPRATGRKGGGSSDRIGSAMPKITDNLDKIASNTDALNKKPGEIVFKNKLPYIPIRGGFAEPTVQKSAAPSLTSLVMQQAEKFISTVTPWQVSKPQPLVPVSASGSASVAVQPAAGDVFNITVNVPGGVTSDAHDIARIVREEMEAAQRRSARQQRARLSDS